MLELETAANHFENVQHQNATGAAHPKQETTISLELKDLETVISLELQDKSSMGRSAPVPITHEDLAKVMKTLPLIFMAGRGHLQKGACGNLKRAKCCSVL